MYNYMWRSSSEISPHVKLNSCQAASNQQKVGETSKNTKDELVKGARHLHVLHLAVVSTNDGSLGPLMVVRKTSTPTNTVFIIKSVFVEGETIHQPCQRTDAASLTGTQAAAR